MKLTLPLLTLLLPACGAPAKMAVDQPAAFIQSNTLDDATRQPANLACLPKKTDPAAPTAPSTLQLTVIDFEKKSPVRDATVEVYTTLAKFNAATPDATSSPTDVQGHAMITVPAGSYRVIFRTVGDASTVETIEFNRAFDDGKRYSVSQSTKGTIGAVLSIVPDNTLGVVAGSLRDCDEKEVGGVTFETHTTSGPAFDNSLYTFYFIDASATSTVPFRAQKFTSGNGVFASLNVPPGNVQLVASGRTVTGGAIAQLGTGTAPVRANSVTVVQIEPSSL